MKTYRKNGVPVVVAAVATVVLCLPAASWDGAGELATRIRALNRQGEWQKALTQLDASDATPPALAHLLRAETYWYGGRLDDARDSIGRVAPSDERRWVQSQELLVRIEYLDGRIERCVEVAAELRKIDAGAATARSMLALCFLRKGLYDEAERLVSPAIAGGLSPVILGALRADVFDVRGDGSSAEEQRRALIPLLNEAKAFDPDELVAATGALRKLGEFEAANQCLQLAQDLDVADPFMKLEKVRLFRATQGYAIAGKTAKQLVERYPSFALAKAEWAEVLWDRKTRAEDVLALCEDALATDPTLLDARCRLIFYALLGGESVRANTLIARNLAVNPRHARTLHFRTAGSLLAARRVNDPAKYDPALGRIMTDLLAAKGDYGESLSWASAVAAAQPESGTALHELGLAKFRTGDYRAARSLLERALGRDSFALQTRNLLTYLDKAAQDAELDSPLLRVVHPPEEKALGRYAELRGRQFLERQLTQFNTQLDHRLRIQLCDNLDDLAVITQGIPFGCSCDPAHPATTGVVSFDDTVFLWTPKATRGARPNYRWDEALHRGIAQAVVRAATDNRAPLWLREGLAGYILLKENPEWAPANIGEVMANLHGGKRLPLAKLEEGFLGSLRPFYQVYAPLLLEEWSRKYGEPAIRELLDETRRGTRWVVALEELFGKGIDEIDLDSKTNILIRYWAFRGSARESAVTARRFLDAGEPEKAAQQVLKTLNRNPYDTSEIGVYLDVVNALGATEEKPVAYYHLLEALLHVKRSDANIRWELAQWRHANGRFDKVVDYCVSAVGIRPQWLAAHSLLAETATELGRYELAYVSLATLHQARAKHVKTLEQLVVCAQKLGLVDDLGRWKASLRTLAPQSPLSTLAPAGEDLESEEGV